MTFKKLVKMITYIETAEQFNEACREVDRAFDTAGKITWEDHELLIALLDKILALYKFNF